MSERRTNDSTLHSIRTATVRDFDIRHHGRQLTPEDRDRLTEQPPSKVKENGTRIASDLTYGPEVVPDENKPIGCFDVRVCHD
jgi:hypothetical protein